MGRSETEIKEAFPLMYHIEIKSKALKELESIPRKVQKRILNTIDSLRVNPRPHGSIKLHGTTNRWRIRIGDYRILYTVDDVTEQVFIFRTLHRKDVYR